MSFIGETLPRLRSPLQRKLVISTTCISRSSLKSIIEGILAAVQRDNIRARTDYVGFDAAIISRPPT